MKVIFGRKKSLFFAAIGCLVAFIVFTIITKTVDLHSYSINGEEATIGLYTMNSAFNRLTGYSKAASLITDGFLILSVLIGFGFAGLGMSQLIQRKNVLKVDRQILALGCVYVLMGLLYLLFELDKVNCRPYYEGATELEASFPSSHTVCCLCVYVTAPCMIKRYFKDGPLKEFLIFADVMCLITSVLLRAVSGVHWLSDIIAGILLAATIIICFFNYGFEEEQK